MTSARAIWWLRWLLLCVSAGVVFAHVIAYVILAWLFWIFLGQ